MQSNKKVPIERINKFFSQDDFDLEIDFGREWLEGDINIKVILYQVDREETTIDDIYGEAAKEDIMFKDIGGRKGMKSMQVKMEKGTATKEEIAAFNKAVQDNKKKKK